MKKNKTAKKPAKRKAALKIKRPKLAKVSKEDLTKEIVNRLEQAKGKLPGAQDAIDRRIAQLTQGLVEFAAACW